MSSLWWVQRDQLDSDQIKLVEGIPFTGSHLIIGPPGSGKTNILLRRAQYVRSQGVSNVVVLTFTRALAEFVRTGCMDGARQIFPPSLVMTVESWLRWLYQEHGQDLPERRGDLVEWKADLARSASSLASQGRLPKFDAIFVDEAQDLLPEEVQLISEWGSTALYVGDDRQRIFRSASGLEEVRKHVSSTNERQLMFHYRLAPEVCAAADKILRPAVGPTLEGTCQYNGPKPGRVKIVPPPLPRKKQLELAANGLKEQLRVYGDLIRDGDRLGVIVGRKSSRQEVFDHFESDAELVGQSKIVRAVDPNLEEGDGDPLFSADRPICILTVSGCKGIEFRAVHWLFCDELAHYQRSEHYYTVVTRAKTSIDIYCDVVLPLELAKAHSAEEKDLWLRG